MSILVTGKGSSGSWQIRGVQLGNAIGADVIPTAQNVRGRDVLVVKKDNGCVLTGAKSIIWDVVDCWPQPEGNLQSREQHISNIHKIAKRMRAEYLIAATKQMAKDLDTPYYLYHHGRHYQKPHVAPEHVHRVGYEGSEMFLGKWKYLMEQECLIRGWDFVINPTDLTTCDILVAFRDYPYKGYATDNWKSNVKLQNAQNAGVPIICNPEAGYLETATGAELFITDKKGLTSALDQLSGQSERLWRSAQMQNNRYYLADAAKDLRNILCLMGK